jgi:hypothetical protein
MRLHCKFISSIGREFEDDYVRRVRINVKCFDAQGMSEYTVAKLAADQILWATAQTDGASLFDICDADSAGMHDLHVILTEGTNELRDDLQVYEVVDSVLFIHRAVFHPDAEPDKKGVIDAVCNLFGTLTLAVMWHCTTGLPDADLADLGFRRVAGTDLIFRHCALATPFGESNPRVIEGDLCGRPLHAEWVKRAWKADGITGTE